MVENSVEKYASIDIGTNTLRLLIAESNSENDYKVVYRDRAITRLGENVSVERGFISDAAAGRTIDALERFSKSLIKYSANHIKVVGTSVFRRAHNRAAFLHKVFKKTGLNIEVITGEDEALLTLQGISQVINRNGRYVVMDIGGGSTEYILGCGEEEHGAYSIEMGVVSLTEAFLCSDPPTSDELSRLGNKVEITLSKLMSRMKNDGIDPSVFSDINHAVLIGTAGTPTTLAAIDQGMEEYKPEMINGYQLSLDRLQELYNHLSGITLLERRKIPSLEKGREDVIIAGILIILRTMGFFGFNEMVVSDAGLLEGVMIALLSERETQHGGAGLQ